MKERVIRWIYTKLAGMAPSLQGNNSKAVVVDSRGLAAAVVAVVAVVAAAAAARASLFFQIDQGRQTRAAEVEGEAEGEVGTEGEVAVVSAEGEAEGEAALEVSVGSTIPRKDADSGRPARCATSRGLGAPAPGNCEKPGTGIDRKLVWRY
jgi:hypothetical protein